MNTDLSINAVFALVKKYKHYQGIISINKKVRERGQPKFNFHFATLEETLKEVALLSDKKASQVSDIPVKIIKENLDLIAYFILHNFNNALPSSEYPANLKHADIKPIFTKNDKTDKTNYGHISILPNFSKMAMTVKWRKFLDIGGHAVDLLTDLSKAFDCMDHELMIVILMVLALTR